MITFVYFLIAFGMFPMLTRTLFLAPLPFFSRNALICAASYWLQDLFVVFELYLLGCAFPVAFFVVALLIQSYILFDGYLYFRIKDRLGLGYLALISQSRFFFDSAKRLGLREFLTLWGILIIYNAFAFEQMPPPAFSWPLALALVVTGSICLLSKNQSWLYGNAFFALQKAFFFPRRSSKTIGSSPFSFEGEKSTSLSRAFSLFRRVEDFKGEKMFDLSIEKGEKPHVVFLFLESFRAKDVGCLGSRKGATPCFDALAEEGFLFPRFYSNGVLTSHALLASLYGILPFYVSKEAKQLGLAPGKLSSLNSHRFIGIADLLRERGYFSAYFDNTALDYEGHAEFLKGHGFQGPLSFHN